MAYTDAHQGFYLFNCDEKCATYIWFYIKIKYTYSVHHVWLKSVVSIFNYLMCVEARKSYVKVLEQLDKILTICAWVSL